MRKTAQKSIKAPRKKRLIIGTLLLVSLAIFGGWLAPSLQESGVRDVVQTAKSEIEGCTIRGVGASFANGQFALTLPAGCRLSG